MSSEKVTVERFIEGFCKKQKGYSIAEIKKYFSRFFVRPNFSETKFNRSRTENRIKLLHELTLRIRDRNFKGKLLEASENKIPVHAMPVSSERKIQDAIANYDIGRKIAHKYMQVSLDEENRFVFSFERQEHDLRESMWRLILADMSLSGEPMIARLSVNFHVKEGKPVIVVTGIQGMPGKKQNLDEFLKRVKKPWPIFLNQMVLYIAQHEGFGEVKGIPAFLNPYYGKKGFYSGKSVTHLKEGRYDIYSPTFKKLKFELIGKIFSKQRRKDEDYFLRSRTNTKFNTIIAHQVRKIPAKGLPLPKPKARPSAKKKKSGTLKRKNRPR